MKSPGFDRSKFSTMFVMSHCQYTVCTKCVHQLTKIDSRCRNNPSLVYHSKKSSNPTIFNWRVNWGFARFSCSICILEKSKLNRPDWLTTRLIVNINYLWGSFSETYPIPSVKVDKTFQMCFRCTDGRFGQKNQSKKAQGTVSIYLSVYGSPC